MSLRSKHHRQERLIRLHQTALRHISSQGVHGLRLSTLARDLGYTTAALYRYYPSREALIAQLQIETLSALHQTLKKVLQRSDLTDPIAQLLLSAEFYAQYAESSPASFALNSSIYANPTLVLSSDYRHTTILKMGNLLYILAEQLTQAGLSTDTDATCKAMCFWSALYGVILTQKYRDDFSVPHPYELTSSLCIGWGSTREQVDQAYKTVKEWIASNPLASLTQLDQLETL